MEKLKLSMSDIVAMTGESAHSVYSAIKLGHIKTFVVGRRRFARPQAVKAWIDFLESESDKGRVVKYKPARAAAE